MSKLGSTLKGTFYTIAIASMLYTGISLTNNFPHIHYKSHGKPYAFNLLELRSKKVKIGTLGDDYNKIMDSIDQLTDFTYEQKEKIKNNLDLGKNYLQDLSDKATDAYHRLTDKKKKN